MKKKVLAILLAASMLYATGCTQGNDNTPNDGAKGFPERPIEFVACYDVGGGHDLMLRNMLKIIQEEEIVSDVINVVNKPGGSGAVGMGYVNQKEGDGHYLMATTSSFVTTPLTSDTGIDYENFTPIARLGIDPEMIVVNAKSEYNTIEDLVKTGKVLNVGGSGVGSIEHIVTVKLASLSGAELNYIPYQGDGEAISALMGNQIDMIITNPNTAYDYIKSGDFRAIAIATEERVDLMSDVPTFIEQGYDITLSLFRGVAAPKNISDEAKAYYEDLIEKVIQTDQWKEDYLGKNLIVEGYLNEADYKEYLDEMDEVYETTLKELGIIK